MRWRVVVLVMLMAASCGRDLEVLEGSFTVANSVDVETLRGYRVVTGDLVIRADSVAVLSNSSLEEVGGDILMSRQDATSPHVITSVSFARLERAGSIEVLSIDSLEQLDAPKLVEVDGPVRLEYLPGFARIEFPALQDAGELRLSDAPVSQLSLPALTNVGNLVVFDLAAVGVLDLPALQAIDGNFRVSSPGIESFALPELESIRGSAVIESGWRMEDAPKLRVVGKLDVCCFEPSYTMDLTNFESVGGLVARHNVRFRPGASIAGDIQVSVVADPPVDIAIDGLAHARNVAVQVREGGMRSLTLNELVSARNIHLGSEGSDPSNLELQLVELASLETVRELWVLGMADLLELELAKLTTADVLWVAGNPALEALRFPVLETVPGPFKINRNDTLAEISFPSLREVGGFEIFRNSVLPQCQVDVLLAQLGLECGTGGTLCHSNDDTAVCP